MLTKEQYESKWPEIKGGIRNLWGGLTEAEIESAKGDLTEITSLVEERYHETKDEIRKKLDMLMESFDNDTDKNLDPDVSSYQRSPVDTGSIAEDRIARH